MLSIINLLKFYQSKLGLNVNKLTEFEDLQQDYFSNLKGRTVYSRRL